MTGYIRAGAGAGSRASPPSPSTVAAARRCIIGAHAVRIGHLHPSTDPLSLWMFSLSALADDLALLDHHMHESWEDPGSPTVMYFRLIVARVYEGERIVTAMDARAAVAGFLAGISKTLDPCARLRAAYRRDLGVKTRPSSRVSRKRSRAPGT